MPCASKEARPGKQAELENDHIWGRLDKAPLHSQFVPPVNGKIPTGSNNALAFSPPLVPPSCRQDIRLDRTAGILVRVVAGPAARPNRALVIQIFMCTFSFWVRLLLVG